MSAAPARQVLDKAIRKLGSEGERALETQLRQRGIPFEREVFFAPDRNFRADFRIYPDLLIEVDGGAWSFSRHRTGSGFTSDCEKASFAAIHRYRVIHCTTEQVASGECVRWVERALLEHASWCEINGGDSPQQAGCDCGGSAAWLASRGTMSVQGLAANRIDSVAPDPRARPSEVGRSVGGPSSNG